MVRGTREDTKNQPGLDTAAAAEDGACAENSAAENSATTAAAASEDGACAEDASNETATADPGNSAEPALRESFCMTEASRTFTQFSKKRTKRGLWR